MASGACSRVNSWVTRPATASRRRRTRSTAPAKSPDAAAARPDQIELPEREVADAHRGVLAREPDDDHPAGRRHELDGRLHEPGDTRRLEDDLGPVPARPLADGGAEVVRRCDVERVGADCAPVGQAALDPVDEQGGRPAVGSRERQGLTDRACAEDHHVLARLDATSRHGPHGDRDRLDERRQGRDPGLPPERRETTRGRAAPAAPRRRECPSGRSARTRFRDRCGTDSS